MEKSADGDEYPAKERLEAEFTRSQFGFGYTGMGDEMSELLWRLSVSG
jgi:hypothetical protein